MVYIINRGVALIISNEFKGNKKRSACDKDIGLMEELFQGLKFDVIKHKSLTAKKMLQEIKTESKKDYDCFALVISSHGKHVRSSTSSTADRWRHFVKGNDNKKLFINDIIHRLNRSKSLAGKPKLIFLQMCRTKKYDKDDDDEVQIAEEIANQSYDTGHFINRETCKEDDDEDQDDDEDDKKSNDDNGLNDTNSDDSESDEEENVDMSSDESEIAGDSGAVAGNSGAVAGYSGAVAGNSGAVAGNSGAVAGNSGAIAGNSGAVAGNSGAVAGNSGAVAGNSGAVAGNSGAVAGNSGAVEGMALAGPAEITDVFETECPNDFLIMYPVMPGKYAFHGPKGGSPMLLYLNECKSMLLEGRSLLQYLTAVCGKMAMRNTATKLDRKPPAKLKEMLLRNLKAISKKEYRQRLMEIVGGGLGGISLENADEIIVEERLKMHFEKQWADPDQTVQDRIVQQMKRLIGIVLPFKTSACIMHRLKGKITFSG